MGGPAALFVCILFFYFLWVGLLHFFKIIFLFYRVVLLLDFFLFFFVGGPVFFIYISIFLWMDEADIYDDPNYDDIDEDDYEEKEEDS